VARRATLRASDADREAIAERLRKATIEGRLVAEELEDRLEAAFAARTYGQLDAVVADLPLPRSSQRRRPAPRNAGIAHWVLPAVALFIVFPIVVALVVAAAVFVLTGAFAIWAVWLVACWFLLGHRRRFNGPWPFHGPRRFYGPTRFDAAARQRPHWGRF
jgi:Flp pilus assembly protein TadB